MQQDADGVLTGDVSADAVLTSPGATLRVGDFTAGSLTLSAGTHNLEAGAVRAAGDVTLTAAGSILVASSGDNGSAPLVQGNNLTLVAQDGSIGSGHSPIAVLYGGSLKTNAASHGAHVVRLKSLGRGYELGPDWAATILGAA